MNTGERIKKFGEVLFDGRVGWGRLFADAMGVKPPTLHPYFRNEKKPGGGVLERLIELGCNADWLLAGNGDMFAENEAGNRLRAEHPEHTSRAKRSHPTPVMLEPVPAGSPLPVEGHVERWLETLNDFYSYVADSTEERMVLVRAKGRSMIMAGIESGDLLMVDQERKMKERDIVVAIYNGEVTVKRLMKRANKYWLKPENGGHKMIPIDSNDLHLVGVVAAWIRTAK